MTILTPQKLSAAAFASYGSVIEAGEQAQASMNQGRFSRFDELARIDCDGDPQVGVVRANEATPLPFEFDFVECHPRGSQAFIPRAAFSMVVVVAKASQQLSASDLVAFVGAPGQGINYARGTWHMPLIALSAGQEFVVIDAGKNNAVTEHRFDTPITLSAPV